MERLLQPWWRAAETQIRYAEIRGAAELASFLAIDVETANADCASVCQIGMAAFVNGQVIRTWESRIDPEDYFDGWNISIHGIDEEAVRGAPTLPHVWPEIREFCLNRILVHHMPFDRVALDRAAHRYSLEPFAVSWLDSARVARRTWQEFSRKGYGLRNLANVLNISLDHHDALSDAIAAGFVLQRAIEKTGTLADQWLTKSHTPTTTPGSKNREGGPDGPLSGECFVFTGKLVIPRSEAANRAAAAGASVASSVSKKTTIVVVGVQDLRRTGGLEKSSKHRKAESLMLDGHDLRIIGEDDFTKLLESS